jgi:3-hydroxymyristoyl/3-hydroxydecanoyl-(acyl carrier protein) dehydratase
MSIKNLVGVMSALLVGQSALAQVQVDSKVMERGVYYGLGETLARRLNLDIDALKAKSNLQPGENLVVKVDEQSNELNIAIFDNAQFAAARIDIMQGN